MILLWIIILVNYQLHDLIIKVQQYFNHQSVTGNLVYKMYLQNTNNTECNLYHILIHSNKEKNCTVIYEDFNASEINTIFIAKYTSIFQLYIII